MPCHTETSVSTAENYAHYLCKACKSLTKEQMQSIGGLDIYQGLFQWYAEHLLADFAKNYDNPDPTEKNVCLSEAKRLGLELSKTEGRMYELKGLGYSVNYIG